MVESFRPLTIQQSLELGQPVFQRREIRPLVVVARHHRAERQRLAAQVAGGAERFVCTLDRWPASLRLDEDPRSTEPVSEPWIAVAHVRGQRFDPVGQGLRTPLPSALERVRANERAHGFPFARVAEERQRVAYLSALREKVGGTGACFAPLVTRKPLAQFFEKKLTKQRMVVVAQLFATAPVREKMASIKIFQQSWRFFIPCERYSVGRRNGRRNRREHQDVLILRFRAAEDLAGEVLENVLLALAKPLLERRAAAAQVLAQKHQRCNPPFALAMDAFQVVRVKLAASEYCLGFLGRAAQLDLVDARDPAARDEPRELRRRIRARQHHQRNAFGDLLEPL